MKKISFLFVLLILLLNHDGLCQKTPVVVKTLVKNFAGNGSIFVGEDGNIYINEYGTPNSDISGTGKRIFLVSPEGNVSTISKKVSGAVGNLKGKDGTYYFNNGNSFYKSDFMSLKDGKIKKIATLEGFSGDILMDSENAFVYIPSYTHPVLRKVSLDGTVEDYIKDDRLKGVTGITYGAEKTIFVSNFTTGKIFKIDQDRTIRELATLPIVYPGYVIGYITYFEEYIYATGYGANQIYRISMKGDVDVLAGSGKYMEKDGNSFEAGFITPNGIDVDKKRRRLYVSQNGNGKPASLRYIDLPKL